MAEIKINRELLSDVVAALSDYHDSAPCPCTRIEQPFAGCPVAQRISRVQGLLERNP